MRLSLGSLLLLLVPLATSAQPRTALTFEAELASAPRHVAGEPNVAVHVPAGFDASKPLQLVIYVHGLRGCLPVLMGRGETRCDASALPQPGFDLGTHHDAAKTNAILIVPRLYYDKRGGQPGAFGKPDGFRTFVDELMRGPLSKQLGRSLTRSDVAGITLVAHSAGYETAIAILEHGGVASLVRAVVLLDALYGFEERYARFATAHVKDGFKLVVIHLRGGKPWRFGKKLEKSLARALGRDRVAHAKAAQIRAAIATHPIVFAEGRGGHREVPANHMAEVLAALSTQP